MSEREHEGNIRNAVNILHLDPDGAYTGILAV